MLYRIAFVCTEDAEIFVVVLEFVGKLRCCIPNNRSGPESLRQVAPSMDEWHQVGGLRRPVRMLGRVSNSGD